MATFSLFQALPVEIQILILRHYFPRWRFSITVSQSPIIPANFRIGTGCPFNFIFRSAGGRDDLCALWTSRELHEPARKALEQSFTGIVNLLTPGNWHYPQRKPMFSAFILPGLPAQMIKSISLHVNLSVGRTLREPRRPVPKDYLTWRELIEFVDCEKMPSLDSLSIQIVWLGKFDFRIDQIGDVLRGDHDETITNSLQQMMPKVHPGQKRQITNPKGAALKIEVNMIDEVSSWVPTWKDNFSKDESFLVSFHLAGKNTQDLQVTSRILYSINEGQLPDGEFLADGTTWESRAAKRWPQLKLAAKEAIQSTISST